MVVKMRIKEINFPQTKNDKKALLVSLSNKCNYNCEYCCASKNSNVEYIDHFLQLINKIDESLQLVLFGGEPTYYEKFDYFLNRVSKHHEIKILTNGSRQVEWWEQLLEKNKNIKNILLSIHFKYFNKENILSKIEIIKKYCDLEVRSIIQNDNDFFNSQDLFSNSILENVKKTEVPVRDVDNFSEFKYLNNKLKNNKDVVLVSSSNNTKEISRYQLSILKINYYLCICTFPQKTLLVNHDGFLYSCIDDHKPTNILSINDLTQYFKKKVCLSKTCSCNFSGERFFKKEIEVDFQDE